MYQFFVQSDQVSQEEIVINGNDVNHIKNVLRMSEGDEIKVCDSKALEYKCTIASLTDDTIRCKIQSIDESLTELPVDVALYQGLPKSDKMEYIIQKCVELGVSEIVAVDTLRTVAKYDAKKATKKVTRWNHISESAAKQSKRGKIPDIRGVLSWTQMLFELKNYDLVVVPYEQARGMEKTRDILGKILPGQRVAVVIGPEGGFAPSEIEQLVQENGEPISLGRRILRTETAGLVFLAMLSYQIEEV